MLLNLSQATFTVTPAYPPVIIAVLALEKLGQLTPLSNVDDPSREDRQRLEQELSRYQEIFDTH